MAESVDQKHVCAVVVTHNRLPLLRVCIEAIRAQTPCAPDILVVDNDSTDGTREWLRANLSPDMVVYQNNLGSAGGFSAGMAEACARGYDWLWVMDDDGRPDSNCLFELSNATSGIVHYAAPNLIDEKEASHFQAKFGAFECVYDRGGPFNGILISSKLLKIVGVPRKEFFIWGDESEWVDRIKSAGAPMLLCRRALLYHKRTAIANNQRTYYLARNEVWRAKCFAPNPFLDRRVFIFGRIWTVFQVMVLCMRRAYFRAAYHCLAGAIAGCLRSPVVNGGKMF